MFVLSNVSLKIILRVKVHWLDQTNICFLPRREPVAAWTLGLHWLNVDLICCEPAKNAGFLQVHVNPIFHKKESLYSSL